MPQSYKRELQMRGLIASAATAIIFLTIVVVMALPH